LNSNEPAPAKPLPITFRAVAAADCPLIENWMRRPHWRAWWGEVETELGYIKNMIEGRDPTRPFLFLLNGEPAGYIQAWSVRDNLVEPWLTRAPWLRTVPVDSIGVDLSVGVESDLGRGLGTAALKAFVKMLADEGHRNIIIDPDAANARAIRAYEKAGFKPLLVAQATGNREGQSTLIMHLRTDAAATGAALQA
jgi:RimJ/RimL family protein N-acetyltransferase